ncbi:MAG: transposase [Methanothrix sp.]|nr:transposase [Methanothrix sp.]
MSQQNRRHWTPQEKMSIVEEARKGGLPVSEVCRRHGIAPTLFYDWERRIIAGALTGLRSDQPKKRSKLKDDLESENQRLKSIIAEIAEENLKLKKGLWP